MSAGNAERKKKKAPKCHIDLFLESKSLPISYIRKAFTHWTSDKYPLS